MGLDNLSRAEVELNGLLFGSLNKREIDLLRAFLQADGPQRIADLINNEKIKGGRSSASKNKDELIRLGLLRPTEYCLTVSVPADLAKEIAILIVQKLKVQVSDDSNGSLLLDLTKVVTDPALPDVLERIKSADAQAHAASYSNTKIKSYEIPKEIRPLLEELFKAEAEVGSILEKERTETALLGSLSETCLRILEGVTLKVEPNLKTASPATLSKARETLRDLNLITTEKQGRRVVSKLSNDELIKPFDVFLKAMSEIEKLLTANADTEA